MYLNLNGKLMTASAAKIDAESDGLFYGAGCFETLKGYRDKFLHLDKHINRLNEGIQFLTGTNSQSIEAEEVRRKLLELLEANGLQNKLSKVRIQVSLSDRNGYTSVPPDELQLLMIISAGELLIRPSKSVSVITSKFCVVPNDCRPVHLKLSNMIHYRQAAIQAKQHGADDALMFTTGGNIAETSIANIFWEKEGVVYTPSTECDILPGIMRHVVIQLLSELELECRTGAFSIEDILNANQVWITNSVREMIWVRSIDGNVYQNETILKDQLNKLFEEYKNENLK